MMNFRQMVAGGDRWPRIGDSSLVLSEAAHGVERGVAALAACRSERLCQDGRMTKAGHV